MSPVAAQAMPGHSRAAALLTAASPASRQSSAALCGAAPVGARPTETDRPRLPAWNCHRPEQEQQPRIAAKGTPVGRDRHISTTTGIAHRYRRWTTSSNAAPSSSRFKDSAYGTWRTGETGKVAKNAVPHSAERVPGLVPEQAVDHQGSAQSGRHRDEPSATTPGPVPVTAGKAVPGAGNSG